VTPRAAAALAATAAAVAAATTLQGCGSESPDLFEVVRTGQGHNAHVDMVVNDGGTVTCNKRQHALPGKLLLRARAAARDLEDPAKLALHLPPGPGTVLSYKVRLEQGRVSFSDTSRHQPKAFLEVQALTKDISEDVCGLRR
jgi:hypothetical protein